MNLIELLKSKKLNREDKTLIRILELIWHGIATNRRDLRLALEMSKASITRKVERALNDGILEDGETISDGIGRNPVSLQFPADAFYLVGVKFSKEEPNHIVVTDSRHNVIAESQTLNTPDITPESKLASIIQIIDELLENKNIPKEKLLAIGVTLTGVFDPIKGIIRYSSSFDIQKEFNIFDYFRSHYDCPVTMMNLSHLSAVAEKRWGAAKKMEHFIYLSCSGLGAGIYLNNRLYRGHQFQAGEFGFQQLEPQGQIAGDGRAGLLGNLAGGYRVTDALNEIISRGGNTHALQYVTDETPISLEIAAKSAADGDGLCQQLLAKNFEYIARGVVNMAYEFNPQAIFLNPWTSQCPSCSIDIIRRHMSHYGASNWQLKTDILSAKTGKGDQARAATLIPLDQMFRAHSQHRPNL